MVTSLEYFSSLLYSGFYCFEVISERNLDNQICGICGIIGEVYLGDGNQTNCRTTSEVCILKIMLNIHVITCMSNFAMCYILLLKEKFLFCLKW